MPSRASFFRNLLSSALCFEADQCGARRETYVTRSGTKHAGGRLVSIVPERQGYARALKAEGGSPFPVLIDMDNGHALSLGLAIWLGEEMQRIYLAAGWDVPSYQGNQSWILPIPATFVLDANGVIVARHLDPDYRKRMKIDELLASFRRARTPAAKSA
jgi:peroxiredoxin